MVLNRQKFKNLALYVCWRCEDPSKLGGVKLNKILWASDFSAYYRSGDSITGDTYIKRQWGPVPQFILPALGELEREGALSIREVDYFGHKKKEFFARREPDLSEFSAEEISLVDRAIAYVCEEHTAQSISELSHNEIWQLAEMGEEIPYYTVFSRPAELTEMDIEWAKGKIAELEASQG